MFTPQGPSLRELAVQALSSVEHGYDLLAPKFDQTPFRTPDALLEAVEAALSSMGPFDHGLDLCCGTGAGMEVLREVCRESVTGVDISAGMLAVGRERVGSGTSVGSGIASARSGGPRSSTSGSAGSEVASAGSAGPDRAAPGSGGPRVSWVRGDALALPFAPVFDLAVSFGAFGHFLSEELPALFSEAHSVLRPGGRFAFPLPAPAPPNSPWYWAALGFDAAMRVRNALWRPPFVMYYRPFRLGVVRRELERAGFDVELFALPGFGRRPDGSPRCRMVVATRKG
ncbi:class I SAM-dependent methyltransferase [Streptomyces europaeiscabiei]|uniref:class I SAM-dependent methyltransferase n=1 Tax=Streptomyces europaeiscabiei TaxID=146819 RepID=UPI0029B33163|nr:methyltransferase domain-containing protein [Streptomyces europaeiscabiei]MDX3862300.1 methyltransferase domain-containing protein [Streptomyces europaeiscabiei]MDX3876411.1 methyltransferase domain-containing protein [Streptomyces europaeiscabiei]